MDGLMLMQEIRGAVARGWCADANRHKEMDSDLAEAVSQEVYKLMTTTDGLADVHPVHPR